MDFKQLRSFVTVVELGSFTRAAERLYTSQPTISAHIRALEEELHERLFLRTTKSLEITKRGKELYDYAVHILTLQDKLTASWAQDEKTVRIGASTIPSAYILPEVLPQFRARHADSRFVIHQSDSRGVLGGLFSGQFDLGLVGMKAPEENVVFTPFYIDEMVLITPNTPRFAALVGKETALSDILLNEPLLMREDGSGSQKCVDDFLAHSRIDPNTLHITARLNDQESVKNLVAGGLGVAIISKKAIEEETARGKLLIFPINCRSAKRMFYLVQRKGDILSAQAKAFADFVLEFYK